MKSILTGAVFCAFLAGCSGTAPFGAEGEGDTSEGAVYLTEENDRLTLNNIEYDENSDTLTLNNIPFDDGDNEYVRIRSERFNNDFNAYRSAPSAGTNELQYFAVFKRSESGNSQVAAAGTDTYLDFGYGGSGAQRLGGAPNLPTSGIYSYTGDYAAVRATNSVSTGRSQVQFVTGDARLRVDFDDFDETGAVGGSIGNRRIYNTNGRNQGRLDGFISLQDTNFDFETGKIVSATASEVTGGQLARSGSWSGVLAGPNGEEIAGIVFVEGENIREVGGFIAEQ